MRSDVISEGDNGRMEELGQGANYRSGITGGTVADLHDGPNGVAGWGCVSGRPFGSSMMRHDAIEHST
jgi:hypothetical protein